MAAKKEKFLNRMLNTTEKVGNALPHPATLFAIFAASIIVLSWLAHITNWNAELISKDGVKLIEPVNLLNKEGLHKIILNLVHNMTNFAPLGIVLVALLGIGIAESSGLIAAIIRVLVLKAPQKALTFVLVFAGILSNIASDIGYVLLIPLAGVIFMAVNRHPIAGMAAAFAGVSGGFSANLAIGTVDPLLAGISTEAAQILDPNYEVNPTANWFFMMASTFIIAFLGTWVTEKVVEPRLGAYKGEVVEDKIERLTPKEKKGVIYSFIGFLVFIGVILIGLIPENGFLRKPGEDWLSSPVIKGVVAILFVGSAIIGIIYGFIVGKFKSDADVINGMGDSMKTLGLFLVLVFFAAQFMYFFKWSNLGMIFAIKGANFLDTLNMGLIPTMILFIILSATINMFMGSASAKWAILAPVFIPMFMYMKESYSPELTQVVYRIGDSVTNIISPMMSFFALIIAYFQKYEKNSGMGTIISTMIPYSIAFFIGWTILLIIWLKLGIPLGPDSQIFYTPAG